MNISSKYNNINFKGYDAAPLKNIYLDLAYCGPIQDEMEEVSTGESFNIQYLIDNQKWGQDHKTIIKKDDKIVVLADGDVSRITMCEFEARNLHAHRSACYIAGGNSFIGQKTNGDKFLLAGEKELQTRTPEAISLAYGVDKKNIFSIPQQDYHLDMFMRPVGYPYILVNDEDMVFEKIDGLKGSLKDIEQLKEEAADYYFNCKWRGYTKNAARALEDYGFIPISIAGVFGGRINFMNGIVNKKQNGKMTYITNSSKCSSPLYSSIEKIFSEELQQKAPWVDKVCFIKGKDDIPLTYNYMMGALNWQHGGIHCMSVEEPDFSVWV